MKIEEKLAEVGRYANLTPEEQNIVFLAATEITVLRGDLRWSRRSTDEALQRCNKYSRLLDDHIKKITELYGD